MSRVKHHHAGRRDPRSAYGRSHQLSSRIDATPVQVALALDRKTANGRRRRVSSPQTLSTENFLDAAMISAIVFVTQSVRNFLHVSKPTGSRF